MISFLKNLIKRLYFKCKYWDKNILLMHGTNLGSNCIFDGANYIGERSRFDGKIGFGSYIGADCCILADIGKYSSISNHVIVTGG